MSRPAVVVEPGEGHRVGNVEFLARTTDTPFFNLAIIALRPGQGVPRHVHAEEDDSFLVLEGTLSVTVGDDDREAAGRAGHVRARPGRHGPRHRELRIGRRTFPERPRTRWVRPADRARLTRQHLAPAQPTSGVIRTEP